MQLDSKYLASLPQHYATSTSTTVAMMLIANQGYTISDMLVHALRCSYTAKSWVPSLITGSGGSDESL